MMDSNMVPEQSVILYNITFDQAEIIANHFGRNIKELDEYEICEMLDTIIDKLA